MDECITSAFYYDYYVFCASCLLPVRDIGKKNSPICHTAEIYSVHIYTVEI